MANREVLGREKAGALRLVSGHRNDSLFSTILFPNVISRPRKAPLYVDVESRVETGR